MRPVLALLEKKHGACARVPLRRRHCGGARVPLPRRDAGATSAISNAPDSQAAATITIAEVIAAVELKIDELGEGPHPRSAAERAGASTRVPEAEHLHVLLVHRVVEEESRTTQQQKANAAALRRAGSREASQWMSLQQRECGAQLVS